MARANQITDGHTFAFDSIAGIDLHGFLVSWNDSIRVRLAAHSYLKQDGAEQEPMGSEPGAFSIQLALVGAESSAVYRKIVAAIRKQPKGLLTHPLLGHIQAACQSVTASQDLSSGRNAINVTLAFVEDQVNVALAADDYKAPATIGEDETLLGEAVTAYAENVLSAIDASAALVEAGAAFVMAAVESFESNEPDPSTASLLQAVGTSASAAITAANADSDASNGNKFLLVSACQELYAMCLDLDKAIRDARPVVIDYVVASDTTIAAIASVLYGKDGKGMIDTLLAYNRIANPMAILRGARLQVPEATV